MINKTFTNELGNKIKIKIKKTKQTGANHKTKEKINYTGVNISICSIASCSENIITLLEAEELYNCLKKFLNK